MLSSTPSNQPDGFVLKLDANGDFVWVRGFAGLREDKVQGIAYDGQDGLYITGSFEQALDVDPDPTVINYIYAAGGN